MAERFTPETGPESREPIKPLRLSEEEPSGLIGFLTWWRKRGGVFWWTTILAVLSIATLGGLVFWIARDVGHLDFRPAPDMTATITKDKASVSSGDTVVFKIIHVNQGGSEAGAVTVDIELPDALTATRVEPGTPACSQASKLERFASQEAGEITGESGGTMICLLGTRQMGAQGTITLEAEVGDVADGTELDLDVWLTTYRTDTVAKDEEIWSNNCIRLSMVTGSGGQSSNEGLDCSSLTFVSRSLLIKTQEETVAPGGTYTFVVEHETVGGTDESVQDVAVDIFLPNEFRATTLQRFIDERLYPEHPNCTHPNVLEGFEKDGKGEFTDTPGGTITCVVSGRTIGVLGEIEVRAIANAASGTTLDINACVRLDAATSADPNDCRMLAVTVQ